jgi:hypothetical protein
MNKTTNRDKSKIIKKRKQAREKDESTLEFQQDNNNAAKSTSLIGLKNDQTDRRKNHKHTRSAHTNTHNKYLLQEGDQ